MFWRKVIPFDVARQCFVTADPARVANERLKRGKRGCGREIFSFICTKNLILNRIFAETRPIAAELYSEIGRKGAQEKGKC
jgi:hypothetical protein